MKRILAHIMDDEWAAMSQKRYGAGYERMRDAFGERLDNGFDKAGVDRDKIHHEYLLRVAISHIQFTGREKDVATVISMRRLEVYSLSDQARLWEWAGETALWYCGIYGTCRFVRKGVESFLVAAHMLNDFYETESKRSLIDRDLGMGFEEFVEVLSKSELVGGRHG